MKNQNSFPWIKCLVCPESQYVGPTEVRTSKSSDERYLDVEIVFRGECGHRFEMALSRHKGMTEVQFLPVKTADLHKM